MKVRITKAPQKMTYGGQKKHSLDIVRTTIDDYKPDYNDVESRYHRSADPRDESTVEVEGGEIIVEKGPANETRTFKAVGPNHSPDPNKEGGVPMNLKEGSFVYSKRKQGEMGVKGPVLKQFGKSENDKKTYSFAELADQYKVNTFYDILQSDKTDYLQKATAAAMVQKYEDKLADLAILQESRKGFPQGIPQIAEEKFQKMMAYMQQAEQQKQMEQQPQGQMMQQQQSPEMMPPPEMMQQPPMAMYGYNMGGGFVPDYSSVGDMYRYQGGGSTGSQDEQLMKIIAIYSQLTQKPEEEIIQALQSLPEAQQQEALQQMYGVVQQAMSEQQGGGGDQQMMQQQDTSGYYSAPGGEPDYGMQQAQEEQPAEEEQQMKRGGSYSGTYYQGTYFTNGGLYKGNMGFNVTSESTKPTSPLLPKYPAAYADSTINANKNIPYFADLMKGKAPLDKDGMTQQWSIRGMDDDYEYGATPYIGSESYVRPRYKYVNGKHVPMTEDEIYNSNNFITFPSQYSADVFNQEMSRRANSKPNKKAYGGAFVPTYGDSSYNDQFGGEMIYDNNYNMLPRADVGFAVTSLTSNPNPSKKAPKVVAKEKIKDYESQGYKQIPGTKIWEKSGKSVTIKGKYEPGKPGYTKPGSGPQVKPARPGGGGRWRTPGDKIKWENWIKAQLASGVTIDQLVTAGHGTKEGLDPFKGYYKAATPPEVVAGTKGRCLDENGKPDPNYDYDEKTGECTKIVTEDEDRVTYEEGPTTITTIPPGSPGGGDFGGGYYGMPFQDTMGLMAAAAYPPLYIRPFYGEPQGVIPRPTFYDPERELASAQETARGLEQMGSMMNPQSAGAMANYVQANAAKSSADTIGRYQNLNVGVANQFSPLQAQIFNSIAAQKREAADKRYLGEAVAAQQYQNAMRTYARDFAKVLGEGMDAGIKMGQLYDTNPYYTADPFGRLRLKPGVNAADAIMAGTMGGYNRSGATGSSSDLLKRAKELKQQGYSDPVINRVLNMEFPNSYNKKSSSTNDDDVAYGYASSAYPFSV